MPRKPYTMTGNAAKPQTLKKRRKRSFSPSEPKNRKPQNEGNTVRGPYSKQTLTHPYKSHPFVSGRPTSYSEAIADEICTRLTAGETLLEICEDNHLPDRVTVTRWLWKEERAGFAAEYARARNSQADLMDDLIVKTAKNSTAETANADRVRLLAYQWRAARLMPHKYGDRVVQEHTGADGGPLKLAVVVGEPVSAQEWAARHGGAAAAPAIEHAAATDEAPPDEGEDAARKRHL